MVTLHFRHEFWSSVVLGGDHNVLSCWKTKHARQYERPDRLLQVPVGLDERNWLISGRSSRKQKLTTPVHRSLGVHQHAVIPVPGFVFLSRAEQD